MSIRTKLAVLVALPVVALVAVAVSGVRWTSDAAARSRSTTRGAEVALASTRAALETARERGLAAAVLANPGTTSFAQELRFQRGQTDVVLDQLAAALRASPGIAATGAVDQVRARLGKVRAHTDAARAGVGAALIGYSTEVDRLLATGSAGISAIDDADLRATAASYTALTHVADAVALQQSVLVAAYAAGRLEAGERDQAVAAVAVEETWRAQFEQIAAGDARSAYDEALGTPSAATADRLRSGVLALPAGSPVPGDGALWLSATTRKVDLLAAVADGIATDLRATAADRGTAAERARVLLLVLGAAALGLVVLLVVLLDRLVARPLRRLTSAAHGVARDVLPRAVAVAHSRGPDAADAVAEPIEVTGQDEIGELTRAFNAVQRAAVGLAAEQAALRRNVGDVFVNLGRRTQNLITRQLDQLDQLERRTDDPGTLADLFRLDHLATRLRRNAENMLVLAGAESPRPWARPVSIVSVIRAAMAESTDYGRIDLARVEQVAVLGAAVNDISHLLAELLDNALAYSPPTERVLVSGGWMAEGRYGLVIEDSGLGMPSDRMAQANTRVAAPPVDDFGVARFLGLYVVGRLADRHGARVELGDSRFGGVAAEVHLPPGVVVTAGAPPYGPAPTGGGHGVVPTAWGSHLPPAPAPPLTAGTGDG